MSYFDVGAAEQLIARRGYAGVDGILDTIGNIFKTGGKTALDIYGATERTKGQNELLTQQQKDRDAAMFAAAGGKTTTSSGLPSWALPVAGIAAVGVVAFVVLKKRR